MSKEHIRPTTLDGIKRYAKTLKSQLGVPHAKALDLAANAGEFQTYAHARRALENPASNPSGHTAYISIPWRVRETKERGQEVLAVPLDRPLTDLVKPHHLKAVRYFGAFKFYAADHLSCDYVSGSQSEARRHACATARTLTFMMATGLRPSASRNRAYPRGDYGNAMPGHDHSSEWFDPSTKAYVFVDEPYLRGVEDIAPERLAWAEKHGWAIGRPKWLGMYNPDGGCELYLAANKAKGFDMSRTIAALDALPPPFAEADWNGRSESMWPVFQSPTSQAAAAAPRPAPKPRTQRGPNATAGYRTMLARSERRRPAKRMPVEAHAVVGRLLKSVIRDTHAMRGVYKPLDGVRCDLDDWVQCEYNRTELSDSRFFNLYYHEDELPDEPRTGMARIEGHVSALGETKRILAEHYPDCAPLRAMFKAIDKSLAGLQT